MLRIKHLFNQKNKRFIHNDEASLSSSLSESSASTSSSLSANNGADNADSIDAVVWSIGPAQSVFQAIEMMALKEVGALTVLDDQGKLIGIISERDYARKVILEGKSSKDTHVAEIMTSDVITIQLDSEVHECMSMMTNLRIRHLPVMSDAVNVDERRVIRMISIGDLVKSIISEQDFKIEQLERYVRGE
ncbi:MAG: CBS domain-containing protein [Pseudomonadales bacterium]|jgi:signal-transduction protein with cAMP-binding, CBS, and nucleotidyltransferase domain|tara:strand:+ start:19837 stop:20406 length:570 start_codon:yes stop_codon:yes gene_type:complete